MLLFGLIVESIVTVLLVCLRMMDKKALNLFGNEGNHDWSEHKYIYINKQKLQ